MRLLESLNFAKINSLKKAYFRTNGAFGDFRFYSILSMLKNLFGKAIKIFLVKKTNYIAL